MARSRIRVRYPVSNVGVVLLAAILGGIMGIVTLLWIVSPGPWALGHQVQNFLPDGFFKPYVVVTIGQFTPFALVTLFMAIGCAGRPISVKTMSAAACVFPIAAILMILLTGYGLGSMLYFRHAGIVGLVPHWRAPLILMGVSILVFSVVRLTYRGVWATVVEQDGFICGNCGYPAGRGTTANCSECGTEFNVDRSVDLVTRFVNGLAQRRRMTAMVTGAICLAFIAMAFWQQRPFYRFQVLFDPFENPAIVNTDARSLAAVATIDHEGSRYIVHLQRPGLYRAPVMNLYVGESFQLPDGRTALGSSGQPIHQFSPDEAHELLWHSTAEERNAAFAKALSSRWPAYILQMISGTD